MANHGARLSRFETDVYLACGCVLTFPSTSKPAPGEVLWCVRHQNTQVQIKDCYVARCDSCRYSRNHGSALLTAQVKAGTHTVRHPGHVVTVRKRGRIVSTHGQQRGQLTIADLETPPF